MNFRFVFNQFGLLLLVLSGIMLAMGAWALIDWQLYRDATERPATHALLLSGAIGALVGGVLWGATRGAGMVGRREALLLVAVSWLIGAAFAALPFYAWAQWGEPNNHPFNDFVDCYFEAMSGLTTTGATILPNIADALDGAHAPLPRSLLLWRSMTHWLGGLGIVVLFVAVLPSLGAGSKRLYKVEAPGPKAGGVTPSIRETARVLWLIYLGLTAAQIIALRVAGVSWFESVCHTFATLATGGFSTYNSSIAGLDSVWVDVIVIAFMLAAGINFGLYFDVIRGRWKRAIRDTELRVYLSILAIAAVIVCGSLVGWRYATTAGVDIDGGAGQAVRYGLFQVVSIQTTTGFGTADFDAWPFIAKAVLITLMFVGGSAGSTGGGLKVIRVWITIRVLAAEIEKSFRPNVVRVLKIGGVPVDADLRLATVAYVTSMALIVLIGGIVIQVLEGGNPDCTFTTSATASVATLFNIGPGLGLVGPTGNYAFFSDPSKLVMAVLMAIGRLELFTIVVLLSPKFWRNN